MWLSAAALMDAESDADWLAAAVGRGGGANAMSTCLEVAAHLHDRFAHESLYIE